jgi:hypothetical protein
MNYELLAYSPSCAADFDYDEQTKVLTRAVFDYLLQYLEKPASEGIPVQYNISRNANAISSRLSWDSYSRDLQMILVDPVFSAKVMIGNIAFTAIIDHMPSHADARLEPHEIDFEGVMVTAEALQFCARNRLVSCLDLAINLVRKHFLPGSTMRVFLDKDPEELDAFAVLEVNGVGDSDSYLQSYFRYSDEWSDKVDWPSSRMILLNLKNS